MIVLAAGACSDDDDTEAATAESVLGLSKSTCLLIDGPLQPEVAELPVVDSCDEPHSHEIFAKIPDTTHQVYPGFAALEQLAQLECYTAFEPFVDISPFDSTLFISWLVPTLDGWNEENDRDILCVLGRRDGALLNTSAEGRQL